MNIQIGEQIKNLRHSHSMTQEQLAQKLGVSAQAVSKWESGINMPDIQLLPEISVAFGVSIDALFAMTEENRMERIENMIYDVRFLSDSEFSQNERFLKEMQNREDKRAQATLLLAMLYNKRANEYHELASPLAREALRLNPGKKDAHNAIFDAENGPYADWNFTNRKDLIAFYKQVVVEHPEDIRNYFWLLKLLISDGRTEEARDYAEGMKALEHSYHYEMYMGEICKAECKLPEALEWWKKMTEHSPEKWIVWAAYADKMAELCRYEEAIEYYKKAMPMRPKPRFTDCEQAISHICEILGDLDGAIAMQEQMLAVTVEDWCSEGELVDSIHREIQRLRKMRKE